MFPWVLRLAPILFLVNALVLGALASGGYSAQKQSISSLVHTSLGFWQTANFVACGLLTLGLAFYLKGHTTTLHNAHLAIAGAVTLGSSLVLLGIFPADKPGQITAAGRIHGVIFVASVLIQAALQLMVAFSNFPSSASWYLLVSGTITATGLLGMQFVPSYKGIIQRILVGAIVLWVTTGSFWLRK